MREYLKKVVAVVVAFVMVISCVPVSGTKAYAAFEEASSVNLRESTPRLEELILAVNMGFGDDVDDTSQITYAEYYKMLDKLVAIIEPDKLEQWQSKYPKARESREGLDRANAMYMIYAMAEDILGGKYCCFPQRYTFQTWGWLNGYMKAPWDEGKYNLKWDYFPDAANDVDLEGSASNRTAKSFIFSFGQSSCNGYFLFDYDKESNSMRTADPFTWQEAMLSVIRLYESVDPYEMDTQWIAIGDVGTYNKQIITEELISRTQYMVEPTTENLPYFTGFHLGQLPQTGEEVTEAKMRLLADLGFNYVRVTVSCLDFFNEDMTQADMAYIQKLDEIISWGLKYGLHISVQFFDFPGHIQYVDNENNTISADSDFYTNEVKQQRTILMWQTIAKRYKGIPNQVLSFITNHEPDNPARSSGQSFDPYTEEDIERVSKAVISAVREVDADRLQIYETRYDLCIDSFMADANVIQNSIYSAGDFVYWNLETDINLTEGYVPEWPLYELPPILNEQKKSYTVDGFLPAGTKFELQLKYSTQQNSTWPTMTVTADGTEICSNLCDEEGETITFTLPNKADNLEIKIDTGLIYIKNFLVTLPEAYTSEKYYFHGTDNSITNVGTVEKINNSEINVSLGYKFGYDKAVYNKPGQTDIKVGLETAWILDENEGADLTITENAKFTSRYGYNGEALRKRMALYAKQREENNVQGMNMELVTSPYVPVGDTCEYLEDVLSALEEYKIGWAIFCIQDIEATRHPESVLEPVDCGLLLDTKILSVLQKHKGERPCIKVQVPKVEHEYEEVTVDATYEKAGYHAFVCKHCGDEKDYEELPRLQYSFYAALYETEAMDEDTKQGLGGFGSVSELNTALENKTGCLVLTLDQDVELSELPKGEGITSLIIRSKDDASYDVSITGEELVLSCDTSFQTDVSLENQDVTLSGNGHKLTLYGMTLTGTSLLGNNVSITCAGCVSINVALTGADIFSLNECAEYSETDGNINWTNKYMGTHVFINREIKDINMLQMYGDNLYIGETGSFTTDKVAGIYGNLFLKKTGNGLPGFSVQNSMADMKWQIRIYALDTIPDDGVYRNQEGVLQNIETGTVIAHIPTKADSSCLDKLGFMSTWDGWDDYGKKLHQDEILYYDDGTSVIEHFWESEYTEDITPTCKEDGKKSIHCSVCEVVKDEITIPATGEHNFSDQGICDTCDIHKGVIENKDYPIEIIYGETPATPTAENFTINSGAAPTFTWYKGDLTRAEELPTEGDDVLGSTVPSEIGIYTLVATAEAVDGETDYTAAELRVKVVISEGIVRGTANITSKSAELSKIWDGLAVSNPAFTTSNDRGTDDENVTFEYKKSTDAEYSTEAPSDAGTYNVRVIVKADATHTQAVSEPVEFTISKATPTYTKPAELMAKCGDKLYTVSLEGTGFEWTDEDVVLEAGSSENGAKVTKKAKYVPEDTTHYNVVENIDVDIAVTHVKVTDPAVAATCEKAGKTAGSHCSECGKIIEKQGVVKATGHIWDAGKVTKEATETAEGVKTYSCKVCGKTRAEGIPKKVSTESNTENVEPEKGETVKDDKGAAMYEVADVTGKEVVYKATADKNAKTITIPPTVTINDKVYKVTAIADKAFSGCKKLTKVTIGKNVRTIGSSAFSGCSKLKTVSIGSNVTAIGDKAFYKCTTLNKVTIPAKVIKIGKQAFYGCKNLKSITIKTTKLTSSKVGSKAFKGIYAKAAIKVPKSKLASYKTILKAKGVSSKVKIKK